MRFSIALALSCLPLLLFAVDEGYRVPLVVPQDYAPQQVEPSLSEQIDKRMTQAILEMRQLPGLSEEQTSQLQRGVSIAWQTVLTKGVVEKSPADLGVRTVFVGVQGLIEQVLAEELGFSVKSAKGIFLTAMPSTPLCLDSTSAESWLSKTLAQNPQTLYVTTSRAHTVRKFLENEGMLYSAYPKEGLLARSQEQQQTYAETLKAYEGYLFDLPLSTPSLPQELSGALYLFKGQDDETLVFAIQMTQANALTSSGPAKLWFGPLHHPEVQERLHRVSAYLQTHGYQLLHDYLKEE